MWDTYDSILLARRVRQLHMAVLSLSAYPIKGKSLGQPKALKIGHENANKDSQGTVVDNADDESQMIPTPLRVEKIMEEITLPAGIEMKQILHNEFEPDDIGHALQFLEFYIVFGKVCLYYEY
ncbi:hypothetical protein P8452_65149 [Trifolium repens]|nr:hypothetical protein P8452_65149 [Trifolium repens]